MGEAWRARAACAGTGADKFVIELVRGQVAKTDPRVQAALAVCARCPVTEECRSAQPRAQRVGVWGGRYWANVAHGGGTKRRKSTAA